MKKKNAPWIEVDEAFPWAPLIMAAGTLGASALSTFGGKKSGGGGGYTPGQIVTLPQYSFTEPRLRLTSDFIASNIERMNRGEYPTYFSSALPTLREGMSRPLKKTYFGVPGDRSTSVTSLIESAAARTGAGPAVAAKQTNRALAEYAEKETAIDEYLTKLGVDIMSQDAYRFPSLSMSMPEGPTSVVIGGTPYNIPAQPDYMSSIGSSLGNFFGSQTFSDLLNSLFSGTKTTGTAMVTPESITGDWSNLYTGAFNPNWLNNWSYNIPTTATTYSATPVYTPTSSGSISNTPYLQGVGNYGQAWGDVWTNLSSFLSGRR
jgi:hypothetical protein